MLSERWKSLDDFSKSMFEEAANEGRRMYRQRVVEHHHRVKAYGIGKTSSILSYLDYLTANSPITSDIFAPIHILPGNFGIGKL
jgi:hypothetical protein